MDVVVFVTHDLTNANTFCVEQKQDGICSWFQFFHNTDCVVKVFGYIYRRCGCADKYIFVFDIQFWFTGGIIVKDVIFVYELSIKFDRLIKQYILTSSPSRS